LGGEAHIAVTSRYEYKAIGIDGLDGRIAAAFVTAIKSEDVASFLTETDFAAIAANEEAERTAQTRPLIKRADTYSTCNRVCLLPFEKLAEQGFAIF
jgi:hypothetical protein